MKLHKSLMLAVSLAASCAQAAMVDFDLTNPASPLGVVYSESFQYQAGGLSLTVTAWSNGGDGWNPFDDYEPADVGLWGDLGLGVGAHTVDNYAWDYDYLEFQFSQSVVLNSFSLGFIAGSSDDPRWGTSNSDVSTAAWDQSSASWVWSGDVMGAVTSGPNDDINPDRLASTNWLVGAYNPFWNDPSWSDVLNFNDGFKVDGISVGTVSTVPLPAGAWLLLSGVAGFIGWRRKVANRSSH